LAVLENAECFQGVPSLFIAPITELLEYIRGVTNLGFQVDYKPSDVVLGEVETIVTTTNEEAKYCGIQ
jgi:hypothetical protein